jgi:hypothetical protein
MRGVTPMTTVVRDALTAAQKWTGRVIYNTTASEYQRWTGAAWTSDVLANYVLDSEKGAASGVATLDGSGKLTAAQLPTNVPKLDLTTAQRFLGLIEISRAVSSELLHFYVGSESQPRGRVRLDAEGDAIFEWGAGGSTAPDTNLYRDAADRLKTDDRLDVQTFTDAFLDRGNLTGAITIDCAAADMQRIAMTGNISGITFSNVPASGRTFALTLELFHSGAGRTVTWPAAVKWPGATAPTLSTGASDIDIVTLVTRDGGTTWYGFLGGLNY